jgi:hypothetical protein
VDDVVVDDVPEPSSETPLPALYAMTLFRRVLFVPCRMMPVSRMWASSYRPPKGLARSNGTVMKCET